MHLVSLCRSAALAACLAFAVPGWDAAAAPQAPPSAGLSEARALLRAGRFDEALGILQPLLEQRRIAADAIFLYGLAALEASQRHNLPDERRNSLLDEAIASFRKMLVARPGLLRVRLELARAFFFKEEDRLATRHFEQVLAGKPSAAVALNVGRFLNIMRARKRWSLRLGAAFAPDSNIGAGSDERIIYIQGLPFRRTQKELTSSGIGIAAWLGGEYQYPLGDPGAGPGASQWRLRAGGDLSRKEYRASDFDRMTLSGHVGPRWLIGRGSEVSLLPERAP